jgi:hypothetical protein
MNSFKTLKNVSLITLMLSISSLGIAESVLAGVRTYPITHSYEGVHRCGTSQANLEQANIAANNLVKDLRNRYYDSHQVRLQNVAIISAPTRHWEEYDRLGFSKGRKCKTTMTLNVDVDLMPLE